jgi:iron complex transport system ATP-binding protein
MILRAENITFAYDGRQSVLHNLSIELRPGVVTGLFGPNGSGKSTLLRCLNGALTPQSGRVLLGSQAVTAIDRRAIARHVAVVPQDSPSDVPLSVREMVLLGRYSHWGAWAQESSEDGRIANVCMERLGITNLANRPFNQLSGGERQRVVIARALAQQGSVILLDEPNSHLDLAHQLEVYRLARSLADEGQAVLIKCPDLLVSPLMVDTAVVMNGGEAVATGPARDVLCADVLADVFATRARIQWINASQVNAKFE